MDERYLSDWAGTRYGVPAGLERPKSAGALSSWLKTCHEKKLSVAVQGGRTGVSGGAAPADGEHILSMEDMSSVVDFDRGSGVIVVEAGMILASLQDIVESDGWSFPLDLGSRGSCQLGGNAATNAGGSRVIKYGNTRNLVLGLEAVLADGTVLGPPNQLVKNNAGYSISQLLIGSEGTLGVITKLALKLVPLPKFRRAALVALNKNTGVGEVLAHCKFGLGLALSAFEVMWPEYVEAALAAQQSARKLPHTFSGLRTVLIEVEGGEEAGQGTMLERVLSQLCEAGMAEDIVLSSSEKDAKDLWAIRESVGEIQATIRPYVGFDLGMSASTYDAYVHQAKSAIKSTGLPVQAFFFGHAGDGNLHAIIGPCPTERERGAVESALYELLPRYTTTVTAEHGVGRRKKNRLHQARTNADIGAMISIKRALDPHNILNPGRIFDL